MGCFYCDEHHEGREAIMFKVGDMKAGTLYLFKDQAHKGRCALALKSHKIVCQSVFLKLFERNYCITVINEAGHALISC